MELESLDSAVTDLMMCFLEFLTIHTYMVNIIGIARSDLVRLPLQHIWKSDQGANSNMKQTHWDVD